MDVTHNIIIQYFQNLVTQNTHLGDNAFFRMDISEIQGAMRTGITFPCLAIESHEGNFAGSSHTNSLDNKTFAFSILSKPEHGNFNQQNEVLDKAETIGKMFISRLRLDNTDSKSPVYKLIEVQEINYHKVGPLYLEFLYGYRFEVTLKAKKINLKVTPEDWDDITEVC